MGGHSGHKIATSIDGSHAMTNRANLFLMESLVSFRFCNVRLITELNLYVSRIAAIIIRYGSALCFTSVTHTQLVGGCSLVFR